MTEQVNAEQMNQEAEIERVWRTYLTLGELESDRRMRRIFKILPGAPRCKHCYAPFHGLGGFVAKVAYGKEPSQLNPTLCNVCEVFASKHQGGAEIELSLLFADVRGSTTLAESLSPLDFSRLVNRFYNTATRVMIDTNGLIDKIIGDQVAGMYVPGFAGPNHARQAVDAAVEILRATGNTKVQKPWIPLGVGVHTGSAFVGSVGSGSGASDITVLGDVANTAARLSSSAAQGEILVSDSACQAAELDLTGLERRTLELKGKTQPVSVYVMKQID